MENRYDLPAFVLDNVWAAIVERVNSFPEFRNPVLMLMGHGLKILTARPHFHLMYKDFTENTLHGLDCDIMPKEEFWVDLDIEDIP